MTPIYVVDTPEIITKIEEPSSGGDMDFTQPTGIPLPTNFSISLPDNGTGWDYYNSSYPIFNITFP